MNCHAWLVGMSGFALFCLLAGSAFLIWCAWSLFWHLYDSHMENSKRIANSELDSAYRTHMFHVPQSMRDMKGVDK